MKNGAALLWVSDVAERRVLPFDEVKSSVERMYATERMAELEDEIRQEALKKAGFKMIPRG